MKVLMIAPQPFFEPRGTPISVYQRLHALVALGYDIDLLTYHVGQDVEIPGVRIHRVPSISFITHVKIGPSRAKLFLDVLLFFKAILFLVTNKYEVIHSHEEASYMCMLFARIFRVQHVYDMHSSLPRQLENFNYGNYRIIVKLFELLERWVINTCDALITIDSDLQQHVNKINPAVNQITIENLAVHNFNSSLNPEAVLALKENLNLDNKIVVVYTGTFERYQGLGLLLESAAIVRQHHPDISFLLVGGNVFQVNHWRHQVKQRGLEDIITFLGTVLPAEALAYLDLATILISPRTEGTSIPLKIYSYLHAGKPIVATNLTAHTQILSDDTALLVDPSSQAIASGLMKLIGSPELRVRIGEQARKFAKENLDPADYLAKMDTIYRSLSHPADTTYQSTPSLESSVPNLSKSSFPSKSSPCLGEEVRRG